MLRTVIIDDEPHIRDTLARLLARYCRQVSLVGDAQGVADGIRVIRTLNPDLVFLDINMNDGTGFDLLRSFETMDFKVIFISAFDKASIQAFRLSGVEYLVKPINPAELMAAVKRIEEVNQEDLILETQALLENLKP